MDISIIICTRNRVECLQKTLASLGRLELRDGLTAELLVIDNGSSDGTLEVLGPARLANGMNLRAFEERKAGQCFARNRALAEASGEILLWTDDDGHPPGDWLPAMALPILQGAADAVVGGFETPASLIPEWMKGSTLNGPFDSSYMRDSDATDLVGLNMAFSRKVLERVNGFDTTLGPGGLGFGDDTLFSWRLRREGFKLMVKESVRVQHHFDPVRLTPRSLIQRAEQTGRSDAYLDYHWHGRQTRWLEFRLARHWLRYLSMHREESSLSGENLQALASAARSLGYYKQAIHERGRLRKYVPEVEYT